MHNYNKVFGIGFHKTGTTSLAAALSILGFRHNRGLDRLNKEWGQDKCLKLLREKNYQPYFDYLADYDSTADNPWYLLFQELDEQFPKSKFILTLREEDRWLQSAFKFFSGKNNEMHRIIYNQTKIEGNEQSYLERYRQHNTDVMAYFKDRSSDLLIIDFEKNQGWEDFCVFLEKEVINLPFPHFNKTI